MSRAAVTEMVIYAGFEQVDGGEQFGLPPIDYPVVAAHA
jgi:hypothetical protein